MGGFKTASRDEKNFETAGLTYLTRVDWRDVHHQRIVAASLVQGVYVLQSRRNLASPWWVFFHFQLFLELVDKDGSIFGAIFEYSPPASSDHLNTDKAPLFVIAFRGASFKADSFTRDLKLNFQIIIDGLHRTTRFEVAMKAVRDWVIGTAEGGSNVWLAGHSLGAAIALLTGKTMAKEGKFLKAFLFNPPYVYLPHLGIKDEKYVRQGVQSLGTVIKSVISVVDYRQSSGIETEDTLSEWTPNVFVNDKDPISCGYIDHYKHMAMLESIGFGCLARATSKVSLQHLTISLAPRILGKKHDPTLEPLHLLPSVNLTVNQNRPENFFEAHKLSLWWGRDLNLKCCVYR